MLRMHTPVLPASDGPRSLDLSGERLREANFNRGKGSCSGDLQESPQLSAMFPKIGKRVLIQTFEKGVAGISENSSQIAGGRDRARVRLRIEAFRNIKMRFGFSNNFTEIDLAGIPSQSNPTIAASG